MKVQIATPCRVSHLQRYGVTVRGNVTSVYPHLLFFFFELYCSLFLYCTVSACDVRAATLIEVFPCFFPS
jgi:hypothetical protein